MTYTTGSTITVVKQLPQGTVTSYTDAADDAKFHVEIKNGTNTALYSPAAASVSFVNSSLTTSGSITVSGIPLTTGFNVISIKYTNNADFESSTSVTTIGTTIVQKITSASSVTI